ncbi:MAG: putative flagellin subunit, partial [Pseudomonadota bacterium]
MGISIGTNTSALNSLRHLNESVSAEVRTEGKLASGSRIVQAADDAAGLAISSKMNAEIRSYRQSLRNTNDAVSVVQTADGAMSEIASLLIRVRELALQSASGQYTDHDRRMIDTEVQSNLKEITRI